MHMARSAGAGVRLIVLLMGLELMMVAADAISTSGQLLEVRSKTAAGLRNGRTCTNREFTNTREPR